MKKKLYKIELSDQAEEDFDNAYQYYNNESEIVAARFLNEVNISFEKIAGNPELYTKTDYDLRKCVLQKFPFVIYYECKEDIVQIVSVFHTSRNPEIWKNRVIEEC